MGRTLLSAAFDVDFAFDSLNLATAAAISFTRKRKDTAEAAREKA